MSPVKEPPSMFRQEGPLRCSVSRTIASFICISQSPPLKELSHKMGENIWSPSTEPHTDEKPTYNGVQPGFPGDRLWHCYYYPSAMQPSAWYLPPWVG
jgi:hypothetical protein